jgi:hypothetical protein
MTANRIARELWWTNQKFLPVNIISPRLSMALKYLKTEFSLSLAAQYTEIHDSYSPLILPRYVTITVSLFPYLTDTEHFVISTPPCSKIQTAIVPGFSVPLQEKAKDKFLGVSKDLYRNGEKR